MRRYDIDSIRISALFLLILYHAACAFQPWAVYFAFIVNPDTLESIWIFMEMLNIWRLPILFTVSGMGVFFALQHRTWQEFFLNRGARVFIPLVFGSIFIAPLTLILFQIHYQKGVEHIPQPGHLWFLINIFYYSLLALPVFLYWNRHPNNIICRLSSAILRTRFAVILMFSIPILLEALLLKPESYASFALDPVHGPIIGFIFFSSGFFYASLRDDFWQSVSKARFLSVILAFSFYIIRVNFADLYPSHLLYTLATAFEASNWILAAFGFGAAYLNRPSTVLTYLSAAVYPVYILHLPVQQFFIGLLAPVGIPALLKLTVVIIATLGVCISFFEIIRRIKYLRFCLGIKSFAKTQE